MSYIRKNKRRLEPKKTIGFHWQAKWKYILSGMAIFLLGVVLLFLGVRALNQALTVTHWNIDASPSMTKKISEVLKGQNLNFWHSRPAILEQKLLHDVPSLEAVNIHRQLPNTLNIHILLRQRIGLWKNEHGIVYLVDEHGEAYRALQQGENVNLPMLRMHKKYLKMAADILLVLQVSSPQWFSSSSEIFTKGLGWYINFNRGQQWLLPFGLKAVHNVALLSKIIAESPWRDRRWRINTRMGHRWFFREVKHEEVILGG